MLNFAGKLCILYVVIEAVRAYGESMYGKGFCDGCKIEVTKF